MALKLLQALLVALLFDVSFVLAQDKVVRIICTDKTSHPKPVYVELHYRNFQYEIVSATTTKIEKTKEEKRVPIYSATTFGGLSSAEVVNKMRAQRIVGYRTQAAGTPYEVQVKLPVETMEKLIVVWKGRETEYKLQHKVEGKVEPIGDRAKLSRADSRKLAARFKSIDNDPGFQIRVVNKEGKTFLRLVSFRQ